MIGELEGGTEGGEIEPYSYLPASLLPMLAAEGDEETGQQLIQASPFEVFVR